MRERDRAMRPPASRDERARRPRFILPRVEDDTDLDELLGSVPAWRRALRALAMALAAAGAYLTVASGVVVYFDFWAPPAMRFPPALALGMTFLGAFPAHRTRSLVASSLLASLGVVTGFLVGAPPYVSANVGTLPGLAMLVVVPPMAAAVVALVFAEAPRSLLR